MKFNILSGRIQPPMLFLEGEDGGSGGGGESSQSGGSESSPNNVIDQGALVDEPIRSNVDRVEGEKAPSFDKLGGKKTAQTPLKDDKSTQTPPKEEKPAGEAAKPKEQSKKEQPKQTQKPVETKKEDQQPDPKTVKKVEAPKADDKKPIPETDEDLDQLQPPPGATEKHAKSFGEMRTIIKETRAAARAAEKDLATIRAELETTKASSTELPKDVQERLSKYEAFFLMHNAEHDEAFQAEWGSKVTNAEDDLFAVLKQNGMEDAVIAEIKKAGIENWTRWDEVGDGLPLLERRKLERAFDARENAMTAKQAKLAELSKSREDYEKGLGGKKQAEIQAWSKKVEAKSIELCAGEEWSLEKDVPADASEDVKRAIAAHNEKAQEYSKEYVNYVKGSYKQDPEVTAEVALKAVKAGVLAKELEAKETELTRSQARVRELETQLGKIRSSGRTAHTDSPAPSSEAKPAKDEKIGGDGSQAISRYFNKK